MGAEKAAVDVGGSTMFDLVAAALRNGGCNSVVGIGASSRTFCDHIDDMYPGAGPLGGLLTALNHATTQGAERVVVLACDMPGLTGHVISALLDAPGARDRIVVAEGHRIEPLCAAWPVALADAVSAMFNSGERSVAVVLDRLDPISVPIEPNALANVNTPEDLLNFIEAVPDRGHAGQASRRDGLR